MRRLDFFLVSLISVNLVSAQEEEAKVTFDDHIKPILREHCTTCHSQSDQSGGLALDSYSELMAGGSSGDVLSAGRPDGSRLFSLITHQQQPFMPPDEDPMGKEKLDTIRIWIEQGMPENSGSKIKRSSHAAAAMLGTGSAGKPEGPPPMPERVLRQTVIETDRPAAIAALTASPWAPLLAIGGQEQVVLFHSESGELLGILPFPEGEPQSLKFTRDGRQLLIGGGRHGHSGCAVLVDVSTGDRIAKVGDELDIVLAADISPDKQQIAVGGPGRMVRVYDSLSGSLLRELKKHTDWIYCVRFSPDGVLLASGDRSNGLVLWEADSGNIYADLSGHKGAVTCVDFRSDSNLLVSASLDGTVKFWDLMEIKENRSWAAHDGGTNDAQFANEGLLATSGKDGKVKLWNSAGELQREYSGLTESALRVAIVGDASVIASGDWNGRVQLWRSDHPESTLTVAVNPPSIERRLEMAYQSLAQAEQEWLSAVEKARLANEENIAAAGALAEKQKRAATLSTQLEEASAKESTLLTSLGMTDERIAALEAELAELRRQRQTLIVDVESTRQTVQLLAMQAQEAQLVTDQAKIQAEQSLTASQAADQLQTEVTQRRDAANAVVQQANADKQALQQRFEELVELSTKATLETKHLSERIAEAVQQEQSETEGLEKLSLELNALRDRLAVLQKRIEELGVSKQTAEQSLHSIQSTAAQLRNEASQAEQAAVDAQERLKLFEQVYKKPQ